jgi:hypothetical protein
LLLLFIFSSVARFVYTERSKIKITKKKDKKNRKRPKKEKGKKRSQEA